MTQQSQHDGGVEPPALDLSCSNTDADGHFANYDKYATTLRAWLVAYGIGGPVLFVSNDKLTPILRDSGQGWWIVGLFLLAVFVQVGGAAINKWAAHNMYLGEILPERKVSKGYMRWEAINKKAWIDGMADIVAIASLIGATALVVGIVLATKKA